MEQTWARTSKRSLGEREKKTVRLNRIAREGGSTGNRAQRGRSRALPGSCQKVQDVASLQSLPAPFGPPLGCLAFLPKSPVYKLADTGRRLELKQATPSHRSELGKLQSRQAEARASRFAASVLHPGHLGSRRASAPTNTNTQLTLLSAGSRTTPRNATPFSLEESHSLRLNLPFGAWMPQLQGSSTAPSVGLLDQDTGPQTKGETPPNPTHTLRGPDSRPPGLGRTGSSPGERSISGSAPGAPVTPPPPPAPRPRGDGPAAPLARPSPSDSGQRGSRAARPARASRFGSVPAPEDAANPRFRGRESSSAPAGLGARARRGGGAAGEPRAGPAHSGGAVAQPARGAAIRSPTVDRQLSTHPDPGRRRRANGSPRQPPRPQPQSLPRPEARRRRPAPPPGPAGVGAAAA